MLISKHHITLEEAVIGRTIFIPADTAKILSLALQETVGNEDYVMPNGLYFISDVQEVEIKLGLYENQTVKKVITIHFCRWDPKEDTGIKIDLNAQGYVFIAKRAMIADDMLYKVFESVHDLVKANEEKWHCVNCGEKLSIPIGQMRVCSPCEKHFN